MKTFVGAIALSLWSASALATTTASPTPVTPPSITPAPRASSMPSIPGTATPRPAKPAAVTAPKPAANTSGYALPKYLGEIAVKYRKAGSLQADFTQVTETAALKRKKTSSGVLLVHFPEKIRWETLKPDKNLLVSDGKKFWFYTPPFDEGEPGQLIEKKAGDVVSRLASHLISGAFEELSRNGDLIFRVSDAGDATHRTYSSKPRRGGAGTVSEIRVGINPTDKLVTRVELSHRDGNSSIITLSKIELGKKLDDEYFRFTAPPNTDRVSQ